MRAQNTYPLYSCMPKEKRALFLLYYGTQMIYVAPVSTRRISSFFLDHRVFQKIKGSRPVPKERREANFPFFLSIKAGASFQLEKSLLDDDDSSFAKKNLSDACTHSRFFSQCFPFRFRCSNFPFDRRPSHTADTDNPKPSQPDCHVTLWEGEREKGEKRSSSS